MTKKADEIQQEIDNIKTFDDVFKIIEKMTCEEAKVFKVIVECFADRISKEEALDKIKTLDPKLYKEWNDTRQAEQKKS